MLRSNAMVRRLTPLGLVTFLLLGLLPMQALAEVAGVAPQATEILRNAMDYLGQQNRFRVQTRNTIEAVLHSGQKLQFDHTAVLSVQRPNKLRAERHGDLFEQVFYYDGSTLSLHNPDDKYYATLPAPGTLEEMLDFARESLDIVAPAADLIYADAYDLLMQEVTSGFVVGKSVVDGVRCDHLAFRGEQVDWQIWIQEGVQPLPRKMVITSRDVMNKPQFTVVMSQWDMAPMLFDRDFVFTPPAGAQGIEFLPLGGSTDAAR